MGRMILGVIVGYVAMAAFVFITFSLTYILLGTEGSFQPGTYDVSTAWIAASMILGLIGAVIGGLLAVVVGKNRAAAKWLAGVVLVLGFLMAVPVAMSPDEGLENIRTGEVSVMEAMTVAKQPTWIAFLNPVIGAIGVMIGARLRSKPDAVPGGQPPATA